MNQFKSYIGPERNLLFAHKLVLPPWLLLLLTLLFYLMTTLNFLAQDGAKVDYSKTVLDFDHLALWVEPIMATISTKPANLMNVLWLLEP